MLHCDFISGPNRTISLGYFQKHDEYLAQDTVIRKLPMVRRQTGGGAILHDDELTYSLIVPLVDDSKIDIEGLYASGA